MRPIVKPVSSRMHNENEVGIVDEKLKSKFHHRLTRKLMSGLEMIRVTRATQRGFLFCQLCANKNGAPQFGERPLTYCQ